MDKIYDHKSVEEPLYKEWEEKGYFKPEINPDGKPFSIILPPPNANAPLHFGHAMYVIEDILVRYHRMLGDKTLWVPGADHAGFETQFVFEKKLAIEGKSRFDYDRETLYKMILEFVENNRPVMESQLRKLGFSLDWSRRKMTIDPEIVEIVYKNFKKLYDEGLVYRAERLVNYCTFDGTSFSDLEVVTEESEGMLYSISYPVKNGGEIIVATSRPETLYGDAAVMVHPEDLRYKDFVGKTVMLPLTNREIPVVTDEFVKQEFGTGAVKVTPLHNFDDWVVGQRHDLKGVQVIGFDGKMRNTKVVDGLYAKQGRVKTIELLTERGFLKGETKYTTTRNRCYKCKNEIEPLPLEQWFVKMEPLARPAIEAVKKGEIKIHPKSFEKLYFQFLENIRDWNISRQVVWGIRIPAWRCMNCIEIKNQNAKIKNESQNSIVVDEGGRHERDTWIVTSGEKPDKCSVCESTNLEQDSDTFDTWFSSSQWPFATLQSSSRSKIKDQKSKLEEDELSDYETFYPTTVMETGYDILRWWVARMAMMGIYATGKVPFENVVLHGLVNDPLGKKMSKSKGNVINPLELVAQYGADAVRFALVYGTALGNDQSLSYPKLEAARRFTNKLWNMERFIEMNEKKVYSSSEQSEPRSQQNSSHKVRTVDGLKEFAKNQKDCEWVEKVSKLVTEVTKNMEEYQFNQVSEKLYEFVWHQFADVYIEDVKNRADENSFIILNSLFIILLKLLHPMMPFVTDEIYRKITNSDKSIMIEKWPTV